MSSFFIDKTDPHIAEILERLRRVNKILQKTETLVQPTLNNERFLTDEELLSSTYKCNFLGADNKQ